MKLKQEQQYEEYVKEQSARASMPSNSNTFFDDFRKSGIKILPEYKVLDIGCRLPAYTVKELRKHGVDAYGCDIGDMCQQIWDDTLPEMKGKLRQFDIHNGNPFLEIEQYDLITISHVLEHCYNPLLVRDIIDKMLKPGGMVHCILPMDSDNGFLNHGPHRAKFESHDEHKDFWKTVNYHLLYESYRHPNSVTIFWKKPDSK